MADIRKELKLSVKLDDAELKAQLQKLRQEFSSATSGVLGGRRPRTMSDDAKQKAEVNAFLKKEQAHSKELEKLRIDSEKERLRFQDEEAKNLFKRLQKEERERLKIEQKIERERLKTEERVRVERERLEERGKMPMTTRAGMDLKAASGALIKAGGVLTTAAFGLTAMRGMLAEREFRGIEDAAQGRFLEGLARRSGRSEFLPKAAGALGGGLAGLGTGAMLGSFLGPLGTLIGGGVGAIGGGIAGALGLSNAQGELRVKQIQPLIRAFEEARSLAPSRVQGMRGGGVNSSGFGAMGRTGTMFGFSPRETTDQFLQARGNLGNRAASRSMFDMMQLMNVTGIDVGTQSRSAETFAGAGRTNRAAGMTSTIEAVRKGVAAGIDASKSGQFLRETAQYLEQNTGFGALNTDAISTRLAEMARGFAGGGDITDTQMRQARDLLQMTRDESKSGRGISGIGNVVGLQRALGPNATPGQFIAGMNLSQDATIEDIQESLGVDRETAKRVLEAKRPGAAARMGLEAVGAGGALGLGLMAEERGITTEQELGARRGVSGRQLTGADLATATGKFMRSDDELRASREFQLTQAEARFNQQQVEAGFNSFFVGLDEATRASGELAKALKETEGRLREMVDSVRVSAGN